MKRSDLSRIKSGSKWTIAGAVAGVLSQLLIMLSLALFLSPADVGLFAVFLFTLGLGITLLPLGNDFSFVQADILSVGDLRRSVLVAVGLSLAAILVALLASLSWGKFQPLLMTVIFGIVVGLLEAVFLLFSAALQRGLNYRAIEKANILRQILTLILSISLLALTGNVEGAYLGRVLSNLAAFTLLLAPLRAALERGRPAQRFVTEVSKDIFRANLIGYLSRNAEILFAAPQLGVAGIGIYDFGRRIIAQPRTLIGSILLKFTYPLFSGINRIEDHGLGLRFLRRVYRNVLKRAALVGFPVFGLALLLSDPVIPALFGPEWRQAVPVVQVFALFAFVQVLGNNITSSALTALGQSGAVLAAEYKTVIPRIAAVVLASFFGPVWVALAMCVADLGKLLLMQMELSRGGALGLRTVFAATWPIFAALAVSLPVGFGVKALLGGLLGAGVAAAVFVILFVAVVLLGDPTIRLSVSRAFRGARIGEGALPWQS